MIKFIEKDEDLTECVEYLNSIDEISLDIETEGFDCHTKNILLLQVGDNIDQFVIDTKKVNIYPLKNVLESKLILIHNAQFDLRFMLKKGIDVKNIYDTFLVECVLFTGYNLIKKEKPAYHGTGLKDVAMQYCGVELDKSIRGKIHRGLTEQVIKYAADDIKYLNEIKRKQLERAKELKLEKVVELENKAVRVFTKMLFDGIRLDKTKIQLVIDELVKINKDITNKLDNIICKESLSNPKIKPYTQIQMDLFSNDRKTVINWNSSAQKTEILNKLGIKVTSVADKILQFNKTKHKIIPLFIEYSKFAKLYSSFGPTLVKFINPVTKRIHPEIWQILSTGRISMSSPNCQQIPSHSELGKRIKSCFIASEGYKIVSADLSGMELRIIAHFSEEPLWIKTFNEDGDLHSILCSETFGIPIEDVKKPFPNKPDITYRFLQKTINFMTAYGGSKFKFSEVAQISIEDADEIIKKFFSKVPKVKQFLDLLAKTGVKYGYIRTNPYYNRIRWFPTLNRQDGKSIGEIERASKNSIPQGTNADIIKQTLINLQDIIDENNYPVRLLLTVHDEVISECKEEFVDTWRPILVDTMIKTAELIITSIPIKVDPVVSDYWTD